MNKEIRLYNNALAKSDKAIYDLLYKQINGDLPQAESKICPHSIFK